MANTDYGDTGRRGGAAWIYVPVVLILFVGLAFSVAAYTASEPQLTLLESIAAGFGGLAALIVGLMAGALGLVAGLIGAAIGLVAAGGVVATTLFIIGSPIIAIILLILLMRRPKACPNPGAHE